MSERPSRIVRPRFHGFASGLLLGGFLAPLAFVDLLHGRFELASPRSWGTLAVVSSACLLLAGLLITTWPRSGCTLATLGLLGTWAIGLPLLDGAPTAALTVAVLTQISLALLWNPGELFGPRRGRHKPIDRARARGAAVAAVGLWTILLGSGQRARPLELGALGVALTLTFVFTLVWLSRVEQKSPHRVAFLRVGAVLTAVTVITYSDAPWSAACAAVPFAVATALLTRRRARTDFEETSVWELLLGHPERFFVGTFAALCLFGTALLLLPQSAAAHRQLAPLDAFFTSVSAVCVNGLGVLDVTQDLSTFGHAAVLLLVQVGGLGIMTFSTAAIWAFGDRMSLRHEGAVARLLSTEDRNNISRTASRILLFTFGTEGAGTLLLFFLFRGAGEPAGAALWHAVFTSVSAFCNAGISLQQASVIHYQTSPLVLHTIGLLTILGGLSPLAVFALPRLFLRRHHPVSAQIKLIWATTAVLLVGGFSFFLVFEWNDSLGGLGYLDRLHNAWFHSVILRTAGFHSIDLTQIRGPTLTLMMIWMFIGGSPGGTAGGLKTTTVAVLALSVLQVVQGKPQVRAFGREISEKTRHRAAVVTTTAVSSLVVALVALQLTQDIPGDLLLFEAVSALGTAGLTIGATPLLDGTGKLIVAACMFVGRVGGLTLLMFLHQRTRYPLFSEPEEDVDVG